VGTITSQSGEIVSGRDSKHDFVAAAVEEDVGAVGKPQAVLDAGGVVVVEVREGLVEAP
jgi:hypothetical protein